MIGMTEHRSYLENLAVVARELGENEVRVSLAAYEEILERLKAQSSRFDYLFSKIAGHSDYHGDSILSAIECVKEGKEIPSVQPLEDNYINLKRRYDALLKASTPKVLSWEEATSADYCWLEIRNIDHVKPVSAVISFDSVEGCTMTEIYNIGYSKSSALADCGYGVHWRCWTSCPTDKQRKAAKWNEST